MAARPRVDQPHYGAHLADPTYWAPYVRRALSRHRLPVGELEPPFAGSFPTFLVGGLVVKLFGPAFDGTASHATELAMHELLASHPEIPAPALVASGQLFAEDPKWPYLVTERLPGAAIRDADITEADAASVASRLGEVAARVHQLRAPAAVASRALLPGLRATAVERLRRFGLPGHLVEQVPDYLADAPPPSTLIHADITADHVFVDEGRLLGVIDWGDSIVADAYYELVAVYLDALGGRPGLLRSFLDGYGWTAADGFCRRALQGVLEFQFDAIGRIRELVDLSGVATLDDLAERLFVDRVDPRHRS